MAKQQNHKTLPCYSSGMEHQHLREGSGWDGQGWLLLMLGASPKAALIQPQAQASPAEPWLPLCSQPTRQQEPFLRPATLERLKDKNISIIPACSPSLKAGNYRWGHPGPLLGIPSAARG